MIKTTDIIAKFAELLEADAALTAWCMAQFGKAPTIMEGVDLRDKPKESDAPFIILRPGAKRDGREVGEFQYAVSVDWAIVKDEKGIDGRRVSFPGAALAETMGDMIFVTLEGFSLNASLSEREEEIDAMTFYPMVMGGMDLMVSVPNVIGGAVVL